jgi:hypothetical protein
MCSLFAPSKWLAALACVALAAGAAIATDVDGPDDCLRDLIDFGDAPECVPAYPSGVLGQFPTCLTGCGVGTQTFTPLCPPVSTPPGPTGFVRHVQFGPGAAGNFWLGCYGGAAGPFGIDSEPDGKTGSPATGMSACAAGLATDCVEAAFGMTFDQDECWLDGSDAGIPGPPLTLIACTTTSIPYMAWHCGPAPIQVFLNILIDFDADADWNDVLECPDLGCAPEWVVINAPILLVPGCNTLASPPFLVGPRPGPSWLRISLTQEPVPPDYPWAGSAGMAGGQFPGGETEDYPLEIDSSVPNERSSWGEIKSTFR